ncbi:hypothetical protein SGQ44_10440 [Flavobacterium sp. Fl-77]|uniref:Uncharacterized protein n=1 Tax=Flavobacterium flavipigmentatum TaxID=2893884 RepID=A0AAJ2VXF5_9FLAO|nr:MULTISPECIES: hypothetical protein [unclassified Flavobacterium]MDX6182642.1 hypothetical protein [Flavobacterium sp. Fl-33]MDX6186178.1 hypothetical protein [Flavobacterium sp. Fl-77]UFH38325.1 hypothetical protein LNP22_16530 [Flavobacterium sp. F-70]
MKKNIFIVTFIITFIGTVKAQESVLFWQKEKINEENRASMHAAYYVFQNETIAAKKAVGNLKDLL